ncbi:MAG TPA: vitamin K epoxide reductase family protein [Candidatus Saccharimonadales bacterium]|nr:vitamin K epoxide reductase family protein [Candidatus Saccharimonadales bacterium]
MKRREITLAKVLPYILLIGGLIGIVCAGALTLDKIQLLEHPHSQLNCDLNPIVACGPVINQPQASAFFRVPNPLIGLVGFACVATVGGAILAGARFKRWFWLGLQAGVTFAVGFVTWLQFETIFRIHALCPYCMVVWVVTIPIFWYTTLYNLREGNIKTSARYKGFVSFLQRHHGDVLIAWFLIIIAVILKHFWYYWKTVI